MHIVTHMQLLLEFMEDHKVSIEWSSNSSPSLLHEIAVGPGCQIRSRLDDIDRCLCILLSQKPPTHCVNYRASESHDSQVKGDTLLHVCARSSLINSVQELVEKVGVNGCVARFEASSISRSCAD